MNMTLWLDCIQITAVSCVRVVECVDGLDLNFKCDKRKLKYFYFSFFLLIPNTNKAMRDGS